MSLTHRVIRAWESGTAIAVTWAEVIMQRQRYITRPKDFWIIVTSALSFLILFLMGLPTLHS